MHMPFPSYTTALAHCIESMQARAIYFYPSTIPINRKPLKMPRSLAV